MRRTSLLIGMVGALFATGSAADDGVIEINAVRAALGGINGSMISDQPGFPVTITQSGSYRLMSNLTGSDPNTILIEIFAPNVEIDLNGFALSGGFRGVHGAAANVAVVGGSVHGMSETGVWLIDEGGRVERVRALGNGGHGILVEGAGALVVDSIAIQNGMSGIVVHRGAVRRCFVANNGSQGITVIGGLGGVPASLVATENFALASNRAIEVSDGLAVTNVIVVSSGQGLVAFGGQGGTAASGVGGNLFSGHVGSAYSGPVVVTDPNLCAGSPC